MYIVQNQQPIDSAFTLVEVMFMTAVVAITLAVAVPKLSDSNTTAQTTTCIVNLNAIYAAKQQWAVDYKKPSTVAPNRSDIYGAVLYIKVEPVCPAGGTYSFLAVSQKPVCSVAGHTMEATSLGASAQKPLDRP